jgi:hypothetical protein
MEATEPLLLDHVPPGEVSLSVKEPPTHKGTLPAIVPGEVHKTVIVTFP